MENKKSFNEYLKLKSGINFDKYSYWDYNLNGMIDYNLLNNSISLLGKDIGPYWGIYDYGYITFPSNDIFTKFIEHKLTDGDTCESIKNGVKLHYYNSDGVNYMFNQLLNWENNGYGWRDCVDTYLSDSIETDVNNYPRHAIYNINSNDDNQRTRGVFGLNNGDESVIVRYFIRPSHESTRPTVNLLVNEYNNEHDIPIPVTCTFSDDIDSFDISGVQCDNCRILNVIKSPSSNSIYYFSIFPNYIEGVEISIQILENCAKNKNGLYNTESNKINITLSDEINTISIEPMRFNETCNIWLETWKSNTTNYIECEFGIIAGGAFRLAVSPTKGKDNLMYYIQFGNETSLKEHYFIEATEGGFETVIKVFEGDFYIDSENTTIIWFLIDNHRIKLGRGTVINEDIVASFSIEYPFTVQYVSFCGGLNNIMYDSFYVGPKSDNKKMTVTLTTTSPIPTTQPINIILTTSSNFKSFNESLFLVNDINQYISNVKVLNPRQVSFLVTPITSEEELSIVVRCGKGAFTDMNGNYSDISNGLAIQYHTTPLLANIQCDDTSMIPATLTLTFNRDITDLPISSFYCNNNYPCKISNIRVASSRKYLVDITPQYDIAVVYISESSVYDLDGNVNIAQSYEILFNNVNLLTLPANDGYYYTWLETWKSKQAGYLWSKFNVATTRGLYIALSTSNSINDEYYEIRIGMVDENKDYNLHQIIHIKSGNEEIISNITKNLGLSSTITSPMWVNYNKNNISIGLGSIINENVILSYNNPLIKIQYIGFTSGVVKVVVNNIDIGEKTPSNNPTVDVTYTGNSITSIIPITFNIIFSEPVVQFTADKLLYTNGQIFNSFKAINESYYTVDFYLLSNKLPATFIVPSGASFSKQSSSPSVSSQSIVTVLSDEIKEFISPSDSVNYGLWYNQWQFIDNDKSIRFRVSGKSNISIALSSVPNFSGDLYIIKFGDEEDNSNKIISVYNNNQKILSQFTKQIVFTEKYTSLWFKMEDSHISIGEGNILGEQIICEVTDLEPLNIKYFSFKSSEYKNNYKEINIGSEDEGFYVEWEYNISEPIHALPIHINAIWNNPTINFDINSISSYNCDIYNFQNNDNGINMKYSFDVKFINNSDCFFQINEYVVSNSNGDKNKVSKTVGLYYSDTITSCDLSSSNYKQFNIMNENWKSDNESEINVKFSVDCTNNVYVGVTSDYYNENMYQVLLGGKSNTIISIQTYNRKTKQTNSLIDKLLPICSKNQFIDLWISVKAIDKYEYISVGSGNIINQNIITSYENNNKTIITNVNYVTFSNDEEPAIIKNIIVQPRTDIIIPIATFSTENVGPFTEIPIIVYINFNEPVTDLLIENIDLVNCKIVSLEKNYNIFTVRLIPIFSSKSASIHIPNGAVTDLVGNPNKESEIYEIKMDNESIFSIEYNINMNNHYSLWYDQWSVNSEGEILVIIDTSGYTNCIGFIENPKAEYPIYDICIGYDNENTIILKKITAISTELLSNYKSESILISPEYYSSFWIKINSNGLLKIGNGRNEEENTLLSYELDNDGLLLKHVSFTNMNGDYASFKNIIIQPYEDENIPTPTFIPLTDIPSNISPVPLKLEFDIPITGLTTDSFLTDNGVVTLLKGSGKNYLINFLPFGNLSSSLILLPNQVYTRSGKMNTEVTQCFSYYNYIKNYTCPPLYTNFVIKSSGWETNTYGTLYSIFSIKCTSDVIIRLSPWLDGGYPQYILTLAHDNNTRNYITKIEAKHHTVEELKNVPICHKYSYLDYWIVQNITTIRFGKGKNINENIIFEYVDYQPVPSHSISFTSNLYTVDYINIYVGPKNVQTLDGFMYSDIDFPTNVDNIEIYVQWNHDVEDFFIEDIVYENGDINSFTEHSKSLYSFVFIPYECGVAEINIPAGSVTYDSVKSSEILPFYIDFCNKKPIPTIVAPSQLYIEYSPISVTVTFSDEVFGFLQEDVSINMGSMITNFRSNSGSSYQFEVILIGNATESADLFIKENTIIDYYGNYNENSSIIHLPQYGSFVESYTVSTDASDSPLFLKQWSTGAIMDTYIMFDVECICDIHVSYSPVLYDNGNIYDFLIGTNDNQKSKFYKDHILMKEVEGKVCEPGSYITLWARFSDKLSQFGKGTEIGNDIIISYEDEIQQQHKYIGLSNGNEPISFNNIRIGPVESMAPRTKITTSATTFITSRNPIHVNVTFTNDCLGFDINKVETNNEVSNYNQINNKLYTFDFTGFEGINYIFIPSNICKDNNNRPNDESSRFVYQYSVGYFTGTFKSSSGQITSSSPIPVTITFSEETREFTSSSITTVGSVFISDLITTDNTEYSFMVYSQDSQTTYLTIEDGKIHDIYGNNITNVLPFALPRYDSGLTVFAPTSGLNGYPFYTESWTSPARSNIEVTFSVICSRTAGIGFGESMNNDDDSSVYEITLGALDNTETIIRRGRNGKQVAVALGKICQDSTEVELWAIYKNGNIKIGKGNEIESNIIIDYTDNIPIPVKHVYFTSYSDAVSYSKINIGPKNINQPVLSVDSVNGRNKMIEGKYHLSTDGILYCLALYFPSIQPSIDTIIKTGVNVTITRDPSPILLDSLIGGAKYDVWCYAESDDKISIIKDNIEETKRTVLVYGSSDFPVFEIKFIKGRSKSIYIEYSMQSGGYLYAYAVVIGSDIPTADIIKQYGTKRRYIVYTTDIFEIKDLVYLNEYDVYFYSESILGHGAPQEIINNSKQTITTNGECPEYNNLTCNNKGDCNDGLCECKFSWHKRDCSAQCPGFIGNDECSGHGLCMNDTVTCSCNDLYHGDGCNLQCPNDGKNECNGKDHGYCEIIDNTAKCHCNDGWEGKDCSKIPGEGGLSIGMIIGIIIGSIILLSIVGCLGYYFFSKRLYKPLKPQNSNYVKI